MKENEVIFTDIHDEALYDKHLANAVSYALMSIPFTFDRMGIRDLKKKIINIGKGKFAENLFFEYLKSCGVPIDTVSTTTPFFSVDKRDFILNGIEWDIKNNYLSHAGQFLTTAQYLELMALIPNRGNWDQWSKRNLKYFPTTKSTAYVFTFMKKSDPQVLDDFFSIRYSFEQEQFIRELYEKYEGKSQTKSPYEESWFWKTFNKIDGTLEIVCHFRPQMVITGVALPSDYEQFVNLKPSQVKGSYMRTIIQNMGIPIKELTSLKKLIESDG